MTMNADAVREIAGLARDGQHADQLITEINGRTYTTRPLTEIRTPDPAALELTTLPALADYLRFNRDALESGAIAVHVVGPREVRVVGHLDDDNRRYTYAVAKLPDRMAGGLLTFGRYADLESVNIGLQTLFAPNEDRAAVLRLVGNVRGEQITEHTDDGVSQAVTARAGVVRVEQVPVPNPVLLQPYRTFPEVEQPTSPFVLRIRKGQNGVEAALFEADGAGWMSIAVQNVAAWLRGALPEGVAVLG